MGRTACSQLQTPRRSICFCGQTHTRPRCPSHVAKPPPSDLGLSFVIKKSQPQRHQGHLLSLQPWGCSKMPQPQTIPASLPFAALPGSGQPLNKASRDYTVEVGRKGMSQARHTTRQIVTTSRSAAQWLGWVGISGLILLKGQPRKYHFPLRHSSSL